MKLFKELGRRNVIRVAIAYAVASWVLLQIVDVVAPILELPDWAPKLIFIILAIGLVPALLFSWAFELTPEGIKKESEVDRSGSISYQTGRKLNVIIVASLALAVVLLLVERQANRTPETAVQSVAESDDGARSVAVLPFVNMSSDAEQEFFSDGITEEILNSLASVKKLNVAGRTSSFAFKGQNDDLRRIGEALGVDHILEGSVRKSGNQVRITAQLVRVDNGFHLWSETYDRELDDVFAIQDEIANEILKQLKNQLLADETVIAVAQRTDPAVYELYLRAKQRMYTRERAQIEMAVSELDEAIRLDPAYAPAFAQRGIATMLLSEQQYGTLPDDEANRRAKRFIDQSLDLDADLAEGWAALGLYNGKSPLGYEESIDNLMKALSINPNLIDASNWLQISLTGVGDYRGALQMLTEIAEKDPLYRPAFSNAITSFNNFGEQDKAEALIERMRAFDPDNPDLLTARAVNYMYSGRRGEGLQAMEERHKFGNMSGLDKVFLSTGLMATMQFERAASEGSPFIQPFALYEAGEVDEAFRRANEQAASGFPETLFYLLNREGRSEEVVNYLEERWPSVSAFAAENPGDQFGYSMMTEVAYAYSRNGNQARFDEAMMYVDQHTSKLVEQGVDNFVFSGNRAVQFALLDDYDAAFSHLRDAVDRGWASGGIPEEVIPAFEELTSDPRFMEIEAAMLATTNRDREIVGLPPMDMDYKVAALTSP